MKKGQSGMVYSPSDLVCYLASGFASWMDRYFLECPGAIDPDPQTEDERLIAETGNEHERAVLKEIEASGPGLVRIPTCDPDAAQAMTLSAIHSTRPAGRCRKDSGSYSAYLHRELCGSGGHHHHEDAILPGQRSLRSPRMSAGAEAAVLLPSRVSAWKELMP